MNNLAGVFSAVFRKKNNKKIIKGRILKGKSTKKLVSCLRPGDMALIDHPDLDEVAVDALLDSGVTAVLNASPFITGAYYNQAPCRLLEKNICLVELSNAEAFERIKAGQRGEIRGGELWADGVPVAAGKKITGGCLEEKLEKARALEYETAADFLSNTLDYARKEKELFLGRVGMPEIRTPLQGMDVVIVVRGKGFREDLQVIRHYLREARPVLIGVDGGGDALMEAGFRPHIVIGDMDSVSDRTLQAADEIIVHAYADGRGAPGEVRLQQMGLAYITMQAPGTSEDIAMLLAYEKNAELILALGTHFGLNDFLDKGRRGMSSTFLVRVRVAGRLIDARGVSRLYKKTRPVELFLAVILAGFLPLLALMVLSPFIRHILHLVWLRLRLAFM